MKTPPAPEEAEPVCSIEKMCLHNPVAGVQGITCKQAAADETAPEEAVSVCGRQGLGAKVFSARRKR